MQDMYDIFKDERRGGGPKGPDAAGTGQLSRQLRVAPGLWRACSTAPVTPNPDEKANPATVAK